VPKVLQTKSSSAPSPRAAQVPRQPVAPPVYRPQATPKAAQSKMPSGARAVLAATTHGTSAPAKTANSVRPITAKTTASTFRAVQMAAARAAHAEEMQVHRVSKARTPAIYWFTFDAIENHCAPRVLTYVKDKPSEVYGYDQKAAQVVHEVAVG